MLDSGSVSNIISKQLAEILHLNIKPLENGDITFLISAGTDRIEICGKATFDIKIGNFRGFGQAWVVQNLSGGMILGNNLMHKYNVILNYRTKTATFQNDDGKFAEVNFVPKDDYLRVLWVTKPVTIRPNTWALVPVLKNRKL